MKVYCPQPETLTDFERELATRLWKSSIDGYALFHFTYASQHTHETYEIDVVLITYSGLFGCLLLRDYKGCWRGSINSQWQADIPIASTLINPHKEVIKYTSFIRDILIQDLFYQTSLFVHNAIVVPDETTVTIPTAVMNQFGSQDKTLYICQLSVLEQSLQTSIEETSTHTSTRSTRQRLTELGLETVVKRLVNLSIEDLNCYRLSPTSLAKTFEQPIKSFETKIPRPTLATSLPIPQQAQTQTPISPLSQDSTSRTLRRIHLILELLIVCLVIGGILIVRKPEAPTIPNPFTMRKPEAPTIPNPFTIGIMTDLEDYKDLADYLQTKLAPYSEELKVKRDGGSKITYEQARNQIATKNWDLLFAYSPMNGVVAEDNGYTWIAKMFPNSSNNYYQSVLFVRQDSSIESLQDITPSTTVALGQIGSASKFFMPIYTLYGKTFILSKDHGRSQEIIDLVKSGQADIGAVAKDDIETDPDLRIIQESRDIPGAGVYLSPQLSPEAQNLVKETLSSAPATVQEAANYGLGEQLDYQEFRKITLTTEDLLNCVDLNQEPVKLFCPKDSSIIGQIKSWQRVDDQQAQLNLISEEGRAYQIFIDLSIMSQIPDCTSPTICNQKRVKLENVEIKSTEGIDQIQITSPDQVYILS